MHVIALCTIRYIVKPVSNRLLLGGPSALFSAPFLALGHLMNNGLPVHLLEGVEVRYPHMSS